MMDSFESTRELQSPSTLEGFTVQDVSFITGDADDGDRSTLVYENCEDRCSQGAMTVENYQDDKNLGEKVIIAARNTEQDKNIEVKNYEDCNKQGDMVIVEVHIAEGDESTVVETLRHNSESSSSLPCEVLPIHPPVRGHDNEESEDNDSLTAPCLFCSICGKTYKWKHSLLRHKKTHGEIQYPCTICDKKFHAKEYLTSHMKSHTRGANLCPDCGKDFKSASYLKRHREMKHENIFKFQCSVCDKTLSCAKRLKEHINRHSESKDRAYKCPLCSGEIS